MCGSKYGLVCNKDIAMSCWEVAFTFHSNIGVVIVVCGHHEEQAIQRVYSSTANRTPADPRYVPD